MRQNAKLRVANRAKRSVLRTAIKKVRLALEEGNAELAKSLLPEALSVIGKSAQKGLIHKNQAARNCSRLTRKVNSLNQETPAT